LSDGVEIPYVKDEDYIYIASDLPFNNKYFEVTRSNNLASVVAVHIWHNNEWTAAVDVIDETSFSGKSMAQSGTIRWKTQRLKGWDIELDSEDVDGVSAVGLYNLYWIRLSFSETLRDSTTIKYIGHRFCTDEELHTFYPELNDSSLKLAFKAEKTDWVDQEIAATEGIILDLTARGIIKTPSQVLNTELFKMPCIHKTAHLIFSAMGRSHEEDAARASIRYEQSMNMKNFQTDNNADGNLNTSERKVTTTFMSR
jgi:hypothetical protein